MLWMGMVFNSKTDKFVYRVFGLSKEDAEKAAREKLYRKFGEVYNYKLVPLKRWPLRCLENCVYKGKRYKHIYLQMFTDYDGKTKINIGCDGCNMNNYNTVKELFKYLSN